MLFTRIHSLKFQNKVAKDSLKRTIKAIGDESLEKGLYFYTFIDIDETNLYVINTWESDYNLIVVTHYVVISALLSRGTSSGEMIITDKKLNILGNIEINY